MCTLVLVRLEKNIITITKGHPKPQEQLCNYSFGLHVYWKRKWLVTSMSRPVMSFVTVLPPDPGTFTFDLWPKSYQLYFPWWVLTPSLVKFWWKIVNLLQFWKYLTNGKDGWMERWMDSWMNGRTDGATDRRTDSDPNVITMWSSNHLMHSTKNQLSAWSEYASPSFRLPHI